MAKQTKPVRKMKTQEPTQKPQEQQQPTHYVLTTEGVNEFVQACDHLIPSRHIKKAIFDVFNANVKPMAFDEDGEE